MDIAIQSGKISEIGAGLLRRAGVGLVSDPRSGLLRPRASELIEAGVNVCLGQDDISDANCPFGRDSPFRWRFSPPTCCG